MKNAQKPDHVSLNTLLNRLQEGRYVVPDFQREFEWEPWDIRDLVKSIFNGRCNVRQAGLNDWVPEYFLNGYAHGVLNFIVRIGVLPVRLE